MTDSKTIFQRLREQRTTAVLPEKPAPKKDVLAEVISRWPIMADAEVRSFVKTLCQACGLSFTQDGVVKLEIRYHQTGYRLWDFVEGKIKINVPTGMTQSGFYLSGCSGRAIPMGLL